MEIFYFSSTVRPYSIHLANLLNIVCSALSSFRVTVIGKNDNLIYFKFKAFYVSSLNFQIFESYFDPQSVINPTSIKKARRRQ